MLSLEINEGWEGKKSQHSVHCLKVIQNLKKMQMCDDPVMKNEADYERWYGR
jgi:hypothetical protein